MTSCQPELTFPAFSRQMGSEAGKSPLPWMEWMQRLIGTLSQTRLRPLTVPGIPPMTMVNMLEAKSSLSRLVQAVESGHEPEIIISRNGRPAAKLVPITHGSSEKRIGVAKGLFRIPDNIDAQNAEIEALFQGDRES